MRIEARDKSNKNCGRNKTSKYAAHDCPQSQKSCSHQSKNPSHGQLVLAKLTRFKVQSAQLFGRKRARRQWRAIGNPDPLKNPMQMHFDRPLGNPENACDLAVGGADFSTSRRSGADET